MTYQVLARKWRPQDFSSVVGQEPIVTALRNAITEQRIAQAYLFSGIRGVGKTSVARILAKALNCLNREGADPCNDCVPCKEITRGSDMDVLEVDAATYSKVEQVRDLTEALKYGPARDAFKVVIIDEIHRLSRQAFDALLKIVEEPPPHLIFVFATTEAEAVPATVLSRCQEFRFRRVAAGRLAEHLGQLAEAEKIEVSETAMRLIARAADGSIRDGVALLDQLSTYGSGTIADEEAARLLGGVGAAFHQRVLGAILEGQGEEITGAVRQLEDEGWDPRHAFSEMLSYTRDALHLALGAEPDSIDLPAEEGKALARLIDGVPYEILLRLLGHLLASENAVRRSEAAALAAEIAWLRAAELPKLTHIEELLGGEDGPRPAARRAKSSRAGRRARETEAGAPAAGEPAAPVAAGSADPVPGEAPDRSTEARARAPVPKPPGTAAPAANAPGAAAASEPAPPAAPEPPAPAASEPASEAKIGDFIDLVSRRRQPLAAHLTAADHLDFTAGSLEIHAAPGDAWFENALRRSNNRQVLEECVQAVWGGGAKWRLVPSEGPVRPAEKPAPEPEDPALKHPAVQAALDIFGGSATTVEDND